jgi:diguanylate cyclase (GGDEF)-like protein
MSDTPQLFSEFTRLLKATVTKQANYGILVALVVVIFSTVFVAYMNNGKVTFIALGEAQRSNFALWVLDVMPVVFALWGQYAGSLIAYEAGALVVDQTNLLRRQTEVLEVQVKHDSSHDHLTDLPNRTLFHHMVEKALDKARANQEILAVLLLDLDDFKEVNKTLGHFSGDMVLKQLAVRLRTTVRDTDTVAHLGGDDFAVLLSGVKQPEDIDQIAQKLCQTVESKFALGGINLNLQMSIGIVHFPNHGDDVDSLLQKAEVALYLAKQHKGCSVETYSPELDTHSPRKLTLMSDLHHAINHSELLLHYQPKVDLASHRVVAFEALVRWQHPQHGLLPPMEFIPAAERTGLIVPMTYWIADQAMAQCARWQGANSDIDVAVNVPVSVLLDHELPKRLTALLHKHGLAPRRLVVEITESSLMEDLESGLRQLTHLSSLGMRISIDDFGTGYSSLAYLRRLPISEIKIDQSFVMGMLESDNDAVIVHATIGLAHNLGKTVIAEGVADAGILKRLTALGCDLAQGHHISPPVDGKQAGYFLSHSEWARGPIRPMGRSSNKHLLN